MLGRTPLPSCFSAVVADDEGELPSIPSALPNTRGLDRDVLSVCNHASSTLSRCVPDLGLLVFGACCVGAMTKRFAGVTFRSSPTSTDTLCEDAPVGFGVCAVKPCLRLDCGFGFDFWVDGGAGARKRCGDGVCLGIFVRASGDRIRGGRRTVNDWATVAA